MAGVGITVSAAFAQVAVDDPKAKSGNSGANPSSASLLANPAGSRSTPTCLSFTDQDNFVIGAAAERLARHSPQSIVRGDSIMCMMGRRADDPFLAAELAPSKTALASNDEGAPGDAACLSLTQGDTSFSVPATEALGHVYAKMVQIASNSLGSATEAAVISVPAQWCSIPSRIAAVRAALAGTSLKSVQICAAEVLACVPYGLDKSVGSKSSTVAVVTLGAGAMRVAVLRLRRGQLRVEAVVENSQITASAFEDALVKNFEKDMCKTEKKGISARSRRRLEAACVEASFKFARTPCRDCPIFVEGGLSGGRDFRARLSRSRFNMLTRGVVERCATQLRTALAGFGAVSKDGAIKVQTVVLAGGGMTHCKLQDRIRALCVGARVLCSVPPEEVFVSGAAQQAQLITAQPQPAAMWTKLTDPEAPVRCGDVNIRISSCAEIMVSGSCSRAVGGSVAVDAASCGGVIEVSEDGRVVARMRLCPPSSAGASAPPVPPTGALVQWTVDISGAKVELSVVDPAAPQTVWQQCSLGGSSRAADAQDPYLSDDPEEEEEEEEEEELDDDEDDDDDLEVGLDDDDDDDDDDLDVGLDEDDDEDGMD